MGFISNYLLFKKYLNRKSIKIFKKLFICISLILFAFPFYYASKERFGGTEEGVYTWIAFYSGQQAISFDDIYSAHGELSYGSGMFPLIYKKIKSINIIPNNKTLSPDEFADSYRDMGVHSNQFGTIIQSFVLDFGRIGGIIASILFGYIVRINIKRIKNMKAFNMSNLLLFILLFQIFFQGIFYFRLYAANWYIIEMIVIIIVFKMSNIKGSNKWIIYAKDKI
jgi:oligosaccharide repeat unit polymerase